MFRQRLMNNASMIVLAYSQIADAFEAWKARQRSEENRKGRRK